VNGNQGSAPNYEPNTLNGPVEDPSKKWAPVAVSGQVGRFAYQHPNTDYEQPRILFRKVFNETQRTNLIENIVGHMSGARRDVSIFLIIFQMYRSRRE
jgi:catalase